MLSRRFVSLFLALWLLLISQPVFADLYQFSGGTGSGGVNQIVAGSGISISPAGGTGVVTITSIAGGGSVTSVSTAATPAWLTSTWATPTSTPAQTIASATGLTSHQVLGTFTGTTVVLGSLAAADLPGAANALSLYNTNGFIVQTTTNTFTGRNITSSGGTIVVTNGSGVGGNPSLDLATTAVTPASYTNTNLTVDQYGRITAASNGSGSTAVTSVTNVDGTLTISPTTGAVVASIASHGVANGNFRQSGSLSVVGNHTTSTADVADISASAAGQLFGSNFLGTSLVFTSAPQLGSNGVAGGTLTLAGATSGSVTVSVPAAAGTSTLFQLPSTDGTNGNVLQTDGAGHTSWQAVGGAVSSVTNVDGTLTVSPTTGAVVASIASNGVANGNIRQSGGLSVIGRSANSTGNVADITATAGGQLFGSNAAGTSIAFSATPQLGVSGTTAGTLTLAGVTSGSSTLQAPASGGTAVILPVGGTTNQFLQLANSGTGATQWASPPGAVGPLPPATATVVTTNTTLATNTLYQIDANSITLTLPAISGTNQYPVWLWAYSNANSTTIASHSGDFMWTSGGFSSSTSFNFAAGGSGGTLYMCVPMTLGGTTSGNYWFMTKFATGP